MISHETVENILYQYTFIYCSHIIYSVSALWTVDCQYTCCCKQDGGECFVLWLSSPWVHEARHCHEKNFIRVAVRMSSLDDVLQFYKVMAYHSWVTSTWFHEVHKQDIIFVSTYKYKWCRRLSSTDILSLWHHIMPLHRLLLGIAVMIVNPCFILCDNVWWRILVFSFISIHGICSTHILEIHVSGWCLWL